MTDPEGELHVSRRVWGTILSTFKEVHYFLSGLSLGMILGAWLMSKVWRQVMEERQGGR